MKIILLFDYGMKIIGSFDYGIKLMNNMGVYVYSLSGLIGVVGVYVYISGLRMNSFGWSQYGIVIIIGSLFIVKGISIQGIVYLLKMDSQGSYSYLLFGIVVSVGVYVYIVGIGVYQYLVVIGVYVYFFSIGLYGYIIIVNVVGNVENIVKNIVFNYIVRFV